MNTQFRPVAKAYGRVRRAALAVTALTLASASIQASTMTVDFGAPTGEFLGGASGTLYGLYDEGLPSNNLIDGINLQTVATKAQNGPQHPGADALEVLGPLVDSSNGDVYVYMTDVHRGFPYQWPGDTPEEKLSLYLDKIRNQAEQIATLPAEYQDNIVLLPYNEPAGNMFGTGEWSYNGISWLNDPQYFFAAWDQAYAVIHDVLPDARIGGPNTIHLYNQVYGFMEHTVAANTVPDVVVWHELSNPATIRSNVNKYRGWEAQIFAGTQYEGTQLPINITEYAYNYHTSVPGQMIQWISALEDSKVYGDIAYWNIDGNLSDSAVQANRANGQWWLLHAYSQMSGETVSVTPPQPNVSYTLQGVATIDDSRGLARILVGGGDGAYSLDLLNLPANLFGDSVHLTVREIQWSGQLGDSSQPKVVAQQTLAVGSPVTTLSFGESGLPALDAESAYELLLTPGEAVGSSAVAKTQWEASYEAEDAVFFGDSLHLNGPEGRPSAVSKFYTSGAYNVGGLRTGEQATLEFSISVPEDGLYDLSVFASSHNLDPDVAEQGPTNIFLAIDGDPATEQELYLTLGYKWVVWDHTDTKVALTAGNHTLSLSTTSLDGTESMIGDVILDKIDLSLANPDYLYDEYEAEYATLDGAATAYYGSTDSSGSGVVDLPSGSTITFWAYSQDDAVARLRLVSSDEADVAITINGQNAVTGALGLVDAFLLGGINKIEVHGSASLSVDKLIVMPKEENPNTRYEAEQAVVVGSAVVENLSLASGGQAVTGIGGAPGNSNSLTFTNVAVPEHGTYAVTFRYSNEEQSPATHYNPDPVARYALISVNGADPVRVAFPHSFHRNNFWELTVPLDLIAGNNSIEIRGEEKPQFDGVTYASDTWPDVLLRSQFAPNIDWISVSPLFSELNASMVQSYNIQSRNITHIDTNVRLEANANPLESAMFIVGPGLAGDPLSTVSFESVDRPGHFLRHSFFEFLLEENDGTQLFASDATFTPVAGLADPSWTSFQSYGFPNRYLRHRFYELVLQEVNSDLDRSDATFRLNDSTH